MKESKYHIYLTDQEQSEIIESLIAFKKPPYAARKIYRCR